MSSEHVERLIQDHSDLMSFLQENRQPSFLVTIESSFPKVALLAAASDLESRVQEVIIEYYTRSTGARDFAVNFVKNKAVLRQFHTYFDWDTRSGSRFFGLFGERFKKEMKAAMGSDEALADSVANFCEIGSLRNQLVHQNYASFTMQNTAQEVHNMYHSALYFVEKLAAVLENGGLAADSGLNSSEFE